MSTPPGALTKSSPGQTDRVAQIVAKATALTDTDDDAMWGRP